MARPSRRLGFARPRKTETVSSSSDTTIARIRRKIDTRMSDTRDLKKNFHDRGNWAYIATSSHAGQEVVSYKFIGGDSDIRVESASPVLT
jgi:hypothetical protein